MGYLILRWASRLDAFSVYPLQARLPCDGVDPQQVHRRLVHPGPLVLRTAPLKYPTPAPDRDRTVYEQMNGSLVGIIGAWTQTSYVDFCLQLLVDFFLGHGKNSFILLFRICGIPSIREFMV